MYTLHYKFCWQLKISRFESAQLAGAAFSNFKFSVPKTILPVQNIFCDYHLMTFALLTTSLKLAFVKISSLKVLGLSLKPQNSKCKLITVNYNGQIFAYK